MMKTNELMLCMGVNQLRTPNIATIATACGFDAIYIDLEHNPTSLETTAGVRLNLTGMFDSLSDRLGDVFERLRRHGALTEADVGSSLQAEPFGMRGRCATRAPASTRHISLGLDDRQRGQLPR